MFLKIKAIFFLLSFLSLPFNLDPGHAASSVDEIRQNSSFYPNNPRQLPLTGSWNGGVLYNGQGPTKEGFTPKWQVEQIKAGKHFFPWFETPKLTYDPNNQYYIDHYKPALDYYKSNNLPFSFVGEQIELRFITNNKFRGLPKATNPLTPLANGAVELKISPFGDSSSWYEIGKEWSSTPMMKQLQSWYPNPPLILYAHNNESPRLQWTELTSDSRMAGLLGTGNPTYEQKIAAVQKGFEKNYKAMLQGIKDGFIQNTWKTNFHMIGYAAGGPAHYGRWSLWNQYSTYLPALPDMGMKNFEGASLSYYDDALVNNINDFQIWSPQVETQNHVFMLNKAKQLNPNFWVELSTWNGFLEGAPNDKITYYKKLGQLATADRYQGLVQFGMWVHRPRVVRDYRGWTETREKTEGYFNAVINSVEKVYSEPILKDFWQYGQLVENNASLHPYQELVDQKTGRWFMLNTSLDAGGQKKLATVQKVFAIALKKGNDYLIYAHSPLLNENNVTITVPGFKSVLINTTVQGTFYLVKADGKVTPVGQSTLPAPQIGSKILSTTANTGKQENTLMPGGLIEIRYEGFEISDFTSTSPLPDTVDNTQFILNDSSGATRKLLFHSKPGTGKLLFQVPFETLPGNATLQIIRPSAQSEKFQIQVTSKLPGINTLSDNGQNIGYFQIYGRSKVLNITPSNYQTDGRIQTGDVLVIYGNGFGVYNGAVSGKAATKSTNYQGVSSVTFRDSKGKTFKITPDYIGPTPGVIGLDQINTRIPSELFTSGVTNPITVTVSLDGYESNTAMLNVASAPVIITPPTPSGSMSIKFLTDKGIEVTSVDTNKNQNAAVLYLTWTSTGYDKCNVTETSNGFYIKEQLRQSYDYWKNKTGFKKELVIHSQKTKRTETFYSVVNGKVIPIQYTNPEILTYTPQLTCSNAAETKTIGTSLQVK